MRRKSLQFGRATRNVERIFLFASQLFRLHFFIPSFLDKVGRSFAKRTTTNNYSPMEIADGIDNVASTRAGEKISSTLTEIEEEEVKKDYVQEKGEEIQAATINPSALSTELVEKREVSCRWLSYRGKIQVCAHPGHGAISDTIACDGRWGDSDSLPALWLELSKDERSRGKFLDLGANIGSCSIEILLATDAHVVSVEAIPEIFLRLKKTVSNLSDEFKERIKVFKFVVSNRGR